MSHLTVNKKAWNC